MCFYFAEKQHVIDGTSATRLQKLCHGQSHSTISETSDSVKDSPYTSRQKGRYVASLTGYEMALSKNALFFAKKPIYISFF